MLRRMTHRCSRTTSIRLKERKLATIPTSSSTRAATQAKSKNAALPLTQTWRVHRILHTTPKPYPHSAGRPCAPRPNGIESRLPSAGPQPAGALHRHPRRPHFLTSLVCVTESSRVPMTTQQFRTLLKKARSHYGAGAPKVKRAASELSSQAVGDTGSLRRAAATVVAGNALPTPSTAPTISW